MIKIKEISERIEEELEDAEYYAMQALKEEDKQLADLYHTLSLAESDHSNHLHDQGVRIINEYKDEKYVIPTGMQAVYDHLHAKHIEKAAKVKAYQDQYK